MMNPCVKSSFSPSSDLYGPCSQVSSPGICPTMLWSAVKHSLILDGVVSGLNLNIPKCLVMVFGLVLFILVFIG